MFWSFGDQGSSSETLSHPASPSSPQTLFHTGTLASVRISYFWFICLDPLVIRETLQKPPAALLHLITPNPLPYWNIGFSKDILLLIYMFWFSGDQGNSPKKKTSRPASPSPPQALSDTTTTPATEIFTAADKEKYRLCKEVPCIFSPFNVNLIYPYAVTEWAKSPVSGKTERETDSDISVKGSELVLTDIFFLLAVRCFYVTPDRPQFTLPARKWPEIRKQGSASACTRRQRNVGQGGYHESV